MEKDRRILEVWKIGRGTPNHVLVTEDNCKRDNKTGSITSSLKHQGRHPIEIMAQSLKLSNWDPEHNKDDLRTF